MTDQSTDTKKKIMEVARILFANQGFEGTSIREIATQAEVNVASVNYHFSNKENLFNEIIQLGYLETSQFIRAYYETDKPTLDDLLVHVFRYFTNKSHDLISYFKMIMSTQHSHRIYAQGTEDELLGPPGGAIIVEAITKDVGGKVSEEELHWAMRCLFSHVVHNALMFQCSFKDNCLPFSSHDDIEKGIRRLTRVVIADLKKS